MHLSFISYVRFNGLLVSTGGVYCAQAAKRSRLRAERVQAANQARSASCARTDL